MPNATTVPVNGKRLRAIRDKRGISQRILSEKTLKSPHGSVSKITIQRMETQMDERKDLRVVQAVAWALDCPAEALTNTGGDNVMVSCRRVTEGHELFDAAKEPEQAELKVLNEPSEQDARQATLDLIKTVRKVVDTVFVGNLPSDYETEFALRQNIDRLEKAGLSIFVGHFHRFMGFDANRPDEYGHLVKDVNWAPGYGAEGNHPMYDVDGVGFCPMILVVVAIEDADEIEIDISINPHGILYDDHGFAHLNAGRVAMGERPLTYGEWEAEYGEEGGDDE
jgi:hypothetical protein